MTRTGAGFSEMDEPGILETFVVCIKPVAFGSENQSDSSPRNPINDS